MINIEKFENESKEIALGVYDSQEKFDEVIGPFISKLDYKTTKIFMRILMCVATEKNKTMAFYSKAISDFVANNQSRLLFDVINDDGNYFKLEEIFEDDSRIFFIDLYGFKKEAKHPFRTELTCSNTDHLKLNKKIIFYDVDHKWKEVKNKESNNIEIEIYSGWIPENFQEKLIMLEFSK